MSRQNHEPVVLIADVDPPSVAELRERLDSEGYVTYYAVSAREAIEHVRKHDIDIAVLSSHLQDLEGQKMIPIMRDMEENMKFIVTSEDNSAELEREVRAQGVVCYELKPLDVDLMMDVIETIVEKTRRTKA